MTNANTTTAAIETIKTFTQTFDIAPEMKEEVERRIARAQKQAAKLGQAFEVSVTYGQLVPVCLPGMDGYALRVPVTITFPVVDLTEWGVLARADLLNNGADGQAVLHSMRRCKIPADGWCVTNKCDECGWERKRHTMYVLQHSKTGEVKRIGSACLSKFVPTADLNLIQAIEAVVNWGLDAVKRAKDLLKTETPKTLVSDFLAHAMDVTRRFGYKKTGANYASYTSYYDLSNPTERLAELSTSRAAVLSKNWPTVIMESLVQDAMVINDWVLGEMAETDYEKNLRAVFNQVALTDAEISKNAELLCSSIEAFSNFMNDSAKHRRQLDNWQTKRDEEARKYLGAVGQRVDFVMTVHFTSRYGVFGQDEQGRFFSLKTPGLYKEGDVVRGRGTVKHHSVAKKSGRPYSVLQRVRVEKREQATA